MGRGEEDREEVEVVQGERADDEMAEGRKLGAGERGAGEVVDDEGVEIGRSPEEGKEEVVVRPVALQDKFLEGVEPQRRQLRLEEDLGAPGIGYQTKNVYAEFGQAELAQTGAPTRQRQQRGDAFPPPRSACLRPVDGVKVDPVRHALLPQPRETSVPFPPVLLLLGGRLSTRQRRSGERLLPPSVSVASLALVVAPSQSSLEQPLEG